MNQYEILRAVEASETPEELREIANACHRREVALDRAVFSSVQIGDRVRHKRSGKGYGVIVKKWPGALAFDVAYYNDDGSKMSWMGLPDSHFVDRHTKARYFQKL